MLKTLKYVSVMREIIEIKRKEFEVIEKVGERSYKVDRKGKIYFLKKFDNDKKGFEEIIKNQEILRNSGFQIPKVYLWDKNSLIFVTDFIDSDNIFNILKNEDLNDEIYEQFFLTFWRCKNSKISLDFDPINFKFYDGKLYYLPFKKMNFDPKRDFLSKDLPLWFFTKEFVKLAHSRFVDVDESRLLSDFEINKKMTLIGIKYYR